MLLSSGAPTPPGLVEDAGGALPVGHVYKRARVFARLAGTLTVGGRRLWWSCHGCGRGCDDLFLPAGQDRLGCRACCRLAYRSQRAPGPVTARKARPVPRVVRTCRVWSPDTGWVIPSRTARNR